MMLDRLEDLIVLHFWFDQGNSVVQYNLSLKDEERNDLYEKHRSMDIEKSVLMNRK